MITKMSTIVVAPDQVSSEVGDEAVILNVKTGVYYGLNDVGSRIWALAKEPNSIGSIIKTLLDEYDVDPVICEAEVLALVQQLIEACLVEVADEKTAEILAT